MAPKTLAANRRDALESFVGLFNLAIATGLLFARISRPTARVMFSDRAVVTQFDGAPTLMFRAANRRRNRIVEAEVIAHPGARLAARRKATPMRRFETLPTVRSRTPVFILTWQIMHRIDEASPLFGETAESLVARRAEIVVVLKGLDETFAQTIHARASYTPDEILWGGRLADIFIAGRRRPPRDRLHALPRSGVAATPSSIARPGPAGIRPGTCRRCGVAMSASRIAKKASRGSSPPTRSRNSAPTRAATGCWREWAAERWVWRTSTTTSARWCAPRLDAGGEDDVVRKVTQDLSGAGIEVREV